MNQYGTKKGWKLIDGMSKKELKIGDKVSTFRGEDGRLTALNPPHKASSQGKVGVELDDMQDGAIRHLEFYASVIGARFEYHGGETQ